ncbi:T9SS type A sorting domain-containing protein [Flavobacterium difficile]|uniref:T9SS type A sorting domain-containing protein n=1 Tax=Flavobacterium difficile TaxID=2709659 RepID=A0ABX0I621_9FLAO|nr:T9SS type A sorting domain-containing protein [Flavobacterium difficile]NHM02643.1 T9SS type A sorting domain-containing protein [Flavobacterium difficile]
MKKITLWLFAIFASWQMSGQVGIFQNFDAGTALPTGWTTTGGGFVNATESCSGNSLVDNLYSFSTTGTLVTPNQVAGSNGTDLTVSFDYKIEDWSSTTATGPGWGNIQVQYSVNNGGVWTTFMTIDDSNHVVANTCATMSTIIPAASVPNASDVRIRFLFTWVSGDYDIYIDNFSATQVTTLPPSCTVLSSPANGATNIASSTISWNVAPGIPTGYRLNVGTTPGGTNILNLFNAGNVTTYDLGALNSGTTYYVTVIPYNANGNATGCTESSFTTCGATTTYPSLETFTTFLPNACWLRGDNGDLTSGPATFGSNGFYADGFANNGFTGAFTYNIFVASANDWIITPEYTIPATGYELKFDAAAVNYNATTEVINWESDDFVEVLVSTTGTSNWTVLYTYNDTNVPSNLGEANIIDLDAYSGQTVRFAYRVVEGTADGASDIEFSIDNFQVRLSPTCPDQTGLTVGTVTATTADFSWSDLSGDGATGYEYAITTSATPPTSGTATTAQIYAATGLSPQTVYYIHVRSSCAAGNFGNWATATFTTACAPITTYPSLEPFATFLPNQCWLRGDNGDLTAGPATFGTNNFYADGFRNVGTTGSFAYNIWVAAANDWIISPEFAIPATGYELKFDAAATNFNAGTAVTNWEADDFVEVLVSTSGTTNWIVLDTYDSSNVPSNLGELNVLDLDAYSGQTVRFAFRVVEGTANGTADLEFFVDNFEVRMTPSCPDQTGLTVGTVTATTADISWADLSGSGALGYEYAITTSATPPASGTATTAQIFAATGLSPQTVYYIHVRATCTAGTFGNWATATFTTACAPITSFPWTENFDSVTIPGFPPCWSEQNGDYQTSSDTFSNTPRSGANYLRDAFFASNEFMWTPGFDLVAGTSYDFSSWVQGDGGSGWIVDYFVNTAQNSTGATQLGATYNVPGTGTLAIQPYAQVTRSFVPATTGTYYFAVRVNQPSFSPNYVAFDDFELKLSPACPTPSASASGVTDVAANLTWTAVPSATLGYEYVLDNVATDPTGAGTSTTATTFAASGLTPLTTYYFHIRSVCAAGTFSSWTTVSFTTLNSPPVNDNLCNATLLTLGTPTGITNTLVGATAQTSEPVPSCFNGGINGSVWFSFVAPSSGSVEVSTDFAGGTLFDGDTEIAVYASNGVNCSDLTTLGTALGCDQDSGTTVNYSSFLSLTGLTSGDTYYIQVDRWGTATAGTFGIQVSTVLNAASFDTNSFVAYPNPVKDILNLSYKTTISNVRVVNLLGQEVLNTKVNANEVQVNMSSLTAGAYVVNITVEDTVHTIKVIKE